MNRRRLNRKRPLVALTVGNAADDAPKWVQVTREGFFAGYAGGTQPFAFTRAALQEMVDNLHAHPSFVAGSDGVGTEPVIPWDYDHASERGDIVANGVPAAGWTYDLEIRNSAAGTAELWALTRFNDVAREQIRNNGYRWASVAVDLRSVDQVSGKVIGHRITSIAMTNQPFIEGMEKLVASTSAQRVSLDYWTSADSPHEAAEMLKDLFELSPTDGMEAVMRELAIVRSWLETGSAPLGTDPDKIVKSLRQILNLPALTHQIDAVGEAMRVAEALMMEQAGVMPPPAMVSPTDGTLPPVEPMAADAAEGELNMELVKALASALGVRENEESILGAVKEVAELRDQLVQTLALSRDGNKVILAAAEEGKTAREKLSGLLEALGVEDADAALNKLATTLEQARKLNEVMPELEQLKVEKIKAEEAAIEADVDAAIAASRLDSKLRPALLLQRKSDPAAFASAFAGATRAPARPDLTKAVTLSTATDLAPETVDLTIYEAPNKIAAAKKHLKLTLSNWDKLNLEEQHIAAVQFTKTTPVRF